MNETQKDRLDRLQDKAEGHLRRRLGLAGLAAIGLVTITLCSHNAAHSSEPVSYESMYQHSVQRFHSWDNDRYSHAFYRVEDHSYDFERDTDDGSLNMPSTLRGTAMLRAAEAECTGTLHEDFSCEASTDAPDFDPGDTLAAECWDTPSEDRKATLECSREGFETEYTATGHDVNRPV